jgi:hypothetical protein
LWRTVTSANNLVNRTCYRLREYKNGVVDEHPQLFPTVLREQQHRIPREVIKEQIESVQQSLDRLA